MTERLARFSGSALDDPRMFGGGARSAEVRYRGETVAHGYLAVVEEFSDPASELMWCTLTVTLPTTVPATLCLDHRTALGRPGVPPLGVVHGPFGDRLFDQSYSVVGDDGAGALVVDGLRAVIMQRPAQRVLLSGSTLLLRTFDGVRATDEVVEWLEQLAAQVLGVTPAFTSATGATGAFPPGLYGPNRRGAGVRRLRPRGVLGRFGRRE